MTMGASRLAMSGAPMADDAVHLEGEADLVSRMAGLAGGEQLSQLAAIVQSCDDAIIGKTLDGIITSWNAGATAMYGYTREEMLGHSISELFPADRAGELDPILERLGRGLRVDHFTTRRVRKDGSVIDVSVSISPILDAGGNVVGAASVARDISAHIRAEANRNVMQARLRESERLETVGRLAAGIAHDFSQVLSVILGYAGILSERLAGDPESQEDARGIEKAAQRGARLTRQLLIFSRSDTALPEEIDLNDMIAGVREVLVSSLGGIELRFDPGDALPPIRADCRHMEQVLLNLADNARDAMPAGGTLTIGTTVTELGDDYCARHPGVRSGRYVELSVRDTGTGMSAEDMVRVFEPFFSTKPLGRGTGLGLSTVHGLVAEAGGSIDVASQVGYGTVFRVFLPPAGTPAAGTPVRATSPSVKRILVVDDDPEMRVIVARILRENGYEVVAARNREEAMALASSPDRDFDLLLTDSLWPQVAPGMTGSAGPLSDMKPGFHALCPAGTGRWHAAFVEKPFTASTLLAKVRSVLPPPPDG
jgi:PAS domain S-box-containing protein